MVAMPDPFLELAEGAVVITEGGVDGGEIGAVDVLESGALEEFLQDLSRLFLVAETGLSDGGGGQRVGNPVG